MSATFYQTPATGDIDEHLGGILQLTGGELSGVLNQLTVSYTLLDQAGNVVGQKYGPSITPRRHGCRQLAGAQAKLQRQRQTVGCRPSRWQRVRRSLQAVAADAEGEEASRDRLDVEQRAIVNVHRTGRPIRCLDDQQASPTHHRQE